MPNGVTTVRHCISGGQRDNKRRNFNRQAGGQTNPGAGNDTGRGRETTPRSPWLFDNPRLPEPEA
jgi:hypothetical protein